MAQTPYSLRVSYVPHVDVTYPDGGDGTKPDPDDPVAPPGSTNPQDDPRPGELTGDWLRLEQEKFPDAPAGGFAKWLQDQGSELTLDKYAEYFEKYGSKCAESGDLSVNIKVHKSRAALAYKIIASYGTLSQAGHAESTEQKSVSVEAAEDTDLQANISGASSAVWEGPVYDATGQQLDQPPTISQSGSKLSWTGKATGTIRTGYTQGYDTYTLTITPRADGDYDSKERASAYSSTVMAFWGDAKVEQLTVDLPDMNGNCAGNDNENGGSGDDDDNQYDGDCYDLYIKYHKCTGEEISRELKSVQCPEVVKADCEKRCNELPHAEIDPCLARC
ncbi:MAG: hypothetical protein ACOYB1_18405 [Limnohabitans sp.]